MNEVEKLNAIIDSYQPKIQALKDENYGLNQELLGYKKGVQAAEIIELKAENGRLKENIEDLSKDLQAQNKILGKFDTTLQEIKEIAENREIFCENCSFCCDEFTCDDCGYVKILQIITKAEEE